MASDTPSKSPTHRQEEDPYAQFAQVYDDWQYLYPQPFTMTMRSRVLGAVREFSVPAERFCDLGCGTGIFAAWWKRRHEDWDVYGIDQSPAMIKQARGQATRSSQKQSLMEWGMSSHSLRNASLDEMLKAAEQFQSRRTEEPASAEQFPSRQTDEPTSAEQLPASQTDEPASPKSADHSPDLSKSGVDFRIGSMTRPFQLPAPMGLITCLFDGMNHLLTTPDFESALAHAHDSLEPGGLFLFDLVGEREFADAFTGAVVRKGPGLVVTADSIHFHRGDRLFGRTTFAIFRQESLDHTSSPWHRFDAEITERCWTRNEVESAIESAGFKVLRREDIDPKNEPEFLLSRSYWICRRPIL